MTSRMRGIIIAISLNIAFSLSVTSCNLVPDIAGTINQKTFETFGKPLFAEKDVLPISKIHLDLALIQGKEVIVEGTVGKLSDYLTYLVLEDTTGKLVVTLNDVISLPEFCREGHAVRVRGVLKYGRNGTPVLQASAFKRA